MTYFQGSRVDETNSGRFSPSEALGIQQQRNKSAAHQFHKPVVTDRMREIAADLLMDIPGIIPLETAIAGEMKEQDNAHHFA
jgi:hypothetical protein